MVFTIHITGFIELEIRLNKKIILHGIQFIHASKQAQVRLKLYITGILNNLIYQNKLKLLTGRSWEVIS